MAKEDEAALKGKVTKLRGQWVSAENNAKKQNLDIAAEKKAKTDKVIDAVEKLGIPAKAWRNEMQLMDHTDAIVSKREELAEADNVDVLQHFDRLILMIAPDALPLFDAATKAAIKKSAAKAGAEEEVEAEPPKAKDKDDGNGKVVQMKPPLAEAMREAVEA